MKKILYNGHIIIDGKTEYDKGYIIIDGEKIEKAAADDEYLSLSRDEYEWIDVKGSYIIPGYIDIHMHGAMGKDFIEGTKDALEVVAKNIVKDGTTSFCASLTVVSQQELLSIFDGYADIDAIKDGANFLGIHSEGPYLSPEYKALMDERYLRDPSIQELDEMLEHANGKLKIMTVAPERQGMDTFIPYAVKHNVTIMMGHTNSNARDVCAAVACGATGFTHLYNAMSQHLHRNPGCVTGAMIEKNTYAEMICDGFHVDPDVVLATFRQFGAERIVMITDSMLGKGMPDGVYTFSGLQCKKTGKHVQVIETGRIAGSAYGMDDMVRSMVSICKCSMKDIVQMACVNPSIVAKVNKSKGTLYPGKDADITVLDKDLLVKRTFVLGSQVFESDDKKSL